MTTFKCLLSLSLVLLYGVASPLGSPAPTSQVPLQVGDGASVGSIEEGQRTQPQSDYDCEVIVDGYTYDLSSLQNNIPQMQYSIYTGTVNVCGIQQECQGFMCFTTVTNPTTFLSAGKDRGVSAYGASVSNGIEMNFTSGSPCPEITAATYSANVHIVCHKGDNSFRIVDQQGCNFQVVISTEDVCSPGTLPKLSGGWIFVIVVLCVATLYCLCGSAINMVGSGREHKHIIPHYSTWSGLGGLVNDGMIFTGDIIRRYLLCQRPGEAGHNPAFKQIKNENL